MKQQRLYPFSAKNHAHDIVFRRNRAKNEWAESGYTNERLEKLIDDLGAILDKAVGCVPVIWLTGKEWALAQESVIWAYSMRK